MSFEIGVLKNFTIFRGKHLLESVFNNVAGQQFSFEYCEIPLVAASKKLINFPGKQA